MTCVPYRGGALRKKPSNTPIASPVPNELKQHRSSASAPEHHIIMLVRHSRFMHRWVKDQAISTSTGRTQERYVPARHEIAAFEGKANIPSTIPAFGVDGQ